MSQSAILNQKSEIPSRLTQIKELFEMRPDIFCRQGQVVPTWRTVDGVRHGPYYAIRYRDGGRQCSIYLGKCQELVEEVRALLAEYQEERQTELHYRHLKAAALERLRQYKKIWQVALAAEGMWLHGFEVRGVRAWEERKRLEKQARNFQFRELLHGVRQHLRCSPPEINLAKNWKYVDQMEGKQQGIVPRLPWDCPPGEQSEASLHLWQMAIARNLGARAKPGGVDFPRARGGFARKNTNISNSVDQMRGEQRGARSEQGASFEPRASIPPSASRPPHAEGLPAWACAMIREQAELWSKRIEAQRARSEQEAPGASSGAHSASSEKSRERAASHGAPRGDVAP